MMCSIGIDTEMIQIMAISIKTDDDNKYFILTNDKIVALVTNKIECCDFFFNNHTQLNREMNKKKLFTSKQTKIC